MQCPKERKVELLNATLASQMAVMQCPDCQGMWIPPEEYKSWQAQQPGVGEELLPATLEVDHVHSSLDTKAAFCPDCNCYLSRAKVGFKSPFYVERCLNCGGIWCDRGEWEILEKLGLHIAIERLFSSDWQVRARQKEQAEQERRATIDKLGGELAQQLFALAEALESHPNGDFGVAYLMRRFNK